MNKPISIDPLDTLNFDNRFIKELPADPISENKIRQVKGACFSYVNPTKVSSPQLVSYSREVADLLEISVDSCESKNFTEVFAGNKLLAGMEPHAMCYGGHQFGNWAGQLGDGRAINLGEIVNSNKQRCVLQLKGAGLTPYSRSADGLAVMRSSIREYLCSEAMHHLGVPTTRALSIVGTGELVKRDMFYDGNPEDEPGAIVCRVSPSFIRFGNFEIFASRHENTLLQKFLDYTIQTDFPHLGELNKETYLQWFAEVSRRTAEMIVHWMRVGFVHGVMNTDNMSILGLTIDYGPYGWIDNYDPTWTPNTTDARGRRYCFGNQPNIGQWNLVQLANAIFPLINDKEAVGEALDQYRQTFQKSWVETIADKLGFQVFEQETDDVLANELLELLTLVETDMTIFFRKLADYDSTKGGDENYSVVSHFEDAYYQPESLAEPYLGRMSSWLTKYTKRLKKDGVMAEKRKEQMNRVNPKYVLRNYMAQLAIDKAEKGDFSLVNELLELVRHPYEEQHENNKYAEKRPEWARNRPGCSMLSCSS